MKGEGNHNFGKSFTKETRKKMSISIRKAKGCVSDEIIIQVRKLVADGHKNTEIQEILCLPSHTITRIKNGEIVCINEEKKSKQSLTQIEVNLSKRKIITEEIIIVIEKLNEKWKPMQILDYLIEERNRKNITNTITIDIIKNIKRNLTNSKQVIYETELPKEKYEYYLKIIKDFNEKPV
jgi:Mg/Co/Ni transporter MgtE